MALFQLTETEQDFREILCSDWVIGILPIELQVYQLSVIPKCWHGTLEWGEEWKKL